MKKHTRLSNVDGVDIIEVVRVRSVAGEGTKENPYHTIIEYFSLLDGSRLARVTPKDNPEEIHKWEGGE